MLNLLHPKWSKRWYYMSSAWVEKYQLLLLNCRTMFKPKLGQCRSCLWWRRRPPWPCRHVGSAGREAGVKYAGRSCPPWAHLTPCLSPHHRTHSHINTGQVEITCILIHNCPLKSIFFIWHKRPSLIFTNPIIFSGLISSSHHHRHHKYISRLLSIVLMRWVRP